MRFWSSSAMLRPISISSYFFMYKKVRFLSGRFGRPSALSGRLKRVSELTWSNLENFKSLTRICTTKPSILNEMALLKTENSKNLGKLNF